MLPRVILDQTSLKKTFRRLATVEFHPIGSLPLKKFLGRHHLGPVSIEINTDS